MSMQTIRTRLLGLPLFVVFLMTATTYPAFAEQEPTVCGEYTYIPPAGYRITEHIYQYDTEAMLINELPWPHTAEDRKTPSIHCILEKNNDDFSYRFSTKKRIQYMSITKLDRPVDIHRECDGNFGKYKAYLLSQKSMASMREGNLSYRIAIEINEEGNKFDTIFAINLSKYDPNQTNEQIAEEMCTLAQQFIDTVKRR